MFACDKQFLLRALRHTTTLLGCIELVNPSHSLSHNFLAGLFSGSAVMAGDCVRPPPHQPTAAVTFLTAGASVRAGMYSANDGLSAPLALTCAGKDDISQSR